MPKVKLKTYALQYCFTHTHTGLCKYKCTPYYRYKYTYVYMLYYMNANRIRVRSRSMRIRREERDWFKSYYHFAMFVDENGVDTCHHYQIILEILLFLYILTPTRTLVNC